MIQTEILTPAPTAGPVPRRGSGYCPACCSTTH